MVVTNHQSLAGVATRSETTGMQFIKNYADTLSVLLLVCALCFISSRSESQSTSSQQARAHGASTWNPRIVRDPQALSIIQGALSALGGEGAIRGVKNLEMDGQITGGSKASFTWQMYGREYRMFSSSATWESEINSGSGSPFRRKGGKVITTRGYADKALFVPGAVAMLLYRFYSNPQYSLQLIANQDSEPSDTVKVRFIDLTTQTTAISTPQVWYFTTSTRLPIRVDSRFFANDQTWPHYINITYSFSNYAGFGGISFPVNIDVSVGSLKLKSYVISDVTLNHAFSANLFASPVGGVQ